MTNNKKIIFTVDDNDSNLTAINQILKPYYTVYPIQSAAKMLSLLEHIKPDLILLDVEMPEMNGLETIKVLKEKDETKEIPVIFLSAITDASSEAEGMELGALDYLHKPIVSTLLLRRVNIYLHLIEAQKMLEEKNKAFSQISQDLKQMINEITGKISSFSEEELLNMLKKLLACTDEFSSLSKETVNIFSAYDCENN